MLREIWFLRRVSHTHISSGCIGEHTPVSFWISGKYGLTRAACAVESGTSEGQ